MTTKRPTIDGMPDNVHHHILIRLPPASRLAFAQAVPGLRSALLTSFPTALHALDLCPGAQLDDAPPATPPHLPDAVRRSILLCGHNLRVLRLHAGLTPLQTRVLLEAARDATPNLDTLAFADAGACDRRLAVPLFERCRRLRCLQVHHATDRLLCAFDRLPLTCARVALTGVSFAALQWVQNAIQALSDEPSRARGVALSVTIVEPLLPTAAATGMRMHLPRFRNIRLLKAFLVDLTETGTWLCTSLSELALRHRPATATAAPSPSVCGLWESFIAKMEDRAAGGEVPLPPYTTLRIAYAHGDVMEISPVLRDDAERSESDDDGDVDNDQEQNRRDTSVRVHMDVPDVFEGILSGGLHEDEIARISEMRVTWGSAHFAELDDEDGAQLGAFLQAHGRTVETVCVDDPLQTPRHDAASDTWRLPCLRLAARLLSWLPAVRRLRVSRHVLEFTACDDAARLVASCAGVAELHLTDPLTPRGGGPAVENIRAQARNLPACLDALARLCPRLRSVYMQEAPDKPSAGPCDQWRTETGRALEAVEAFELERGDVDVSTVRWQVETWKAMAEAF